MEAMPIRERMHYTTCPFPLCNNTDLCPTNHSSPSPLLLLPSFLPSFIHRQTQKEKSNTKTKRERKENSKRNREIETQTKMESGVGGGGSDGNMSTGIAPPSSSAVSDWGNGLSRRFQYLLDKSTPHVLRRWIGFSAIAVIYMIRVYFIQGFYIISYGLGIYILNLLIAFLSPQVDPEIQELSDGPTLPTRGSDEFRPFVRRLPEFKFWYSITKAFCIAFVMTFFAVFDVPVFWPILLFYWLVLFFLTMKRQILHMIKYRYVPFSLGKQRYTGKKVATGDDIPS